MKPNELQFFVSCNLDFSSELEKELKEIWPHMVDLTGKPNQASLKILAKDEGGVLLEAPLHLGLQINLFSKIANRVLLRLSEFTAKDFPKVYQKLSALKKNPIVFDAAKQGFSFEVACSQSRLNNEKRVQEMLEEIFPKTISEANQSLYVRIHQDLCTVSLDTTGENLYLRSERVEQGEAPLRETLAAFCARKLVEGKEAADLKDISLIDPLCGSGTLLLEASQLAQMSARTQFAFMQWPQTPKLFKTPLFRKNFQARPLYFKQLIAGDVDAKILSLCEQRLKAQSLPFEVFTGDVMKISRPPEGPSFVISNPPYGERLKAAFTPAELLGRLVEAYRPLRVGILLKDTQGNPLEPHAKSKTLEGYKLLSKSSFLNGGLRVSFHVFSRFG